METDKWVSGGMDMLLALFTVYLFFFYFSTFFKQRQQKMCVLAGGAVLIIWQTGISDAVRTLSIVCNLGVTVGMTLLAVMILYEGRFWKKCFFALVFDAIWMLLETMLSDLLLIYCERLAFSQDFGSLVSKLLFFGVLMVLKKVFTNEKVQELPGSYSILMIFIPMGSIYIMNAVFILTHRAGWKYGKVYLLVSVLILLFINVLIFYIYIKLAEDLQVRRMNMAYEQQLELCRRHQEETETSMLQMRDVKHSMKNHLLSILAYAEKKEYEKIIKFVNDVIEEGNLRQYEIVHTGNIVVDSLTGYWKRAAEQRGIAFEMELNIPMEMPFKGADISLILGNLLENAVEAAGKGGEKRYISLRMKYDRRNLLITVENSYQGELSRGRGEELKTTKEDAANHGIGLPSVKRTAEKYHGVITIDSKMRNRFLVRVVLYES